MKKFLALSLSDVVFIMLINVKMSTNCWHFNIYEQDKFNTVWLFRVKNNSCSENVKDYCIHYYHIYLNNPKSAYAISFFPAKGLGNINLGDFNLGDVRLT